MYSASPDPCRVCGADVRLRRERIVTLGDEDVLEQRWCTNRGCESNEVPTTLGTPKP